MSREKCLLSLTMSQQCCLTFSCPESHMYYRSSTYSSLSLDAHFSTLNLMQKFQGDHLCCYKEIMESHATSKANSN